MTIDITAVNRAARRAQQGGRHRRQAVARQGTAAVVAAAAVAAGIALAPSAMAAPGNDRSRAAASVSTSTSGTVVTDDLGSIVIGWGEAHRHRDHHPETRRRHRSLHGLRRQPRREHLATARLEDQSHQPPQVITVETPSRTSPEISTPPTNFTRCCMPSIGHNRTRSTSLPLPMHPRTGTRPTERAASTSRFTWIAPFKECSRRHLTELPMPWPICRGIVVPSASDADSPHWGGAMRRRSDMGATYNCGPGEAPGRDSGAAVMEGSGCSVGKRSATIQR